MTDWYFFDSVLNRLFIVDADDAAEAKILLGEWVSTGGELVVIQEKDVHDLRGAR